MQRWIVIGGVVLFLLMGGGIFGFFQYRQNKADQWYMPIPFKAGLSAEDKTASMKQIREGLLTDKVLSRLAKDCGVKEYWKLSSDAEALVETRKRAFIEEGVDKSQSGVSFPSMRVGFRGKRKEVAMLAKMTEHLNKDLQKAVSTDSTDF